MRIYIANDGYTLRKIANQNQIEVAELLALNPTIEDPDQNIGGKPVRLPSLAASGMNPLTYSLHLSAWSSNRLFGSMDSAYPD